MDDCIFCKIIKGELPSYKIYEDDLCLAFLDINPVSFGHTLVVTKEHYQNSSDTPEDVLVHLTKKIKLIAPLILKSVNSEAFNLTMNNGKIAGQLVSHLHWHIIPRFADDKLPMWSGMKVTSEDLTKIQTKIKNSIK